MVQTRLSRVRSFSSQALVWSQSRHRQAHMWLPDDLDRRSILEATPPTTQASPQPTRPAPTTFESWLPMDSEARKNSNCNARRADRSVQSAAGRHISHV